MARFELVSVWRVGSPLPPVWDAISHAERWPEWWHGLVSVVELEPGEAGGIGSLRRFTWVGALPYRLTFDIRITRIEPSKSIEGVASGDVAGVGVWRFSRDDSQTVVRYEWQVRTDAWWLNLLGVIAGPLVRWNHATVMDWGAKGLARRLEAGTWTRRGAHPGR
jgi:hypothetical protein